MKQECPCGKQETHFTGNLPDPTPSENPVSTERFWVIAFRISSEEENNYILDPNIIVLLEKILISFTKQK